MSNLQRTLFYLTIVLVVVSTVVYQCEARPKRKPQRAFDVLDDAIANGVQLQSNHQDTFSAKTKKSMDHVHRPAHLRLRSTPEPEVILPASSSHVLECEAGGNPPPMIHWLKDGKRINQNMDELLGNSDNSEKMAEEGVLGLSFTRSKLYLDCAQADDAAIYTCVAENAFSRMSAHSEVKVINARDTENEEEDNSVALCLTKKSYGAPARIHMWTRTRLEVIGSEAKIFCRSSGSPQPTIAWLGPDESPVESSDKYDVLEDGDLLIKDLSWSDMGGYTCIASNVNGADRSMTFLYPTAPEK
ncbi:Neural/ectodermal development factor IMP-L2 [Halotydeus destructor]|nr:Neural/ectodermal development factor IMP-L2 [Halotydeus destructor]